MIAHNHYSSIGNMVAVPIMLQIVANAFSVRDRDVLIQDSVANVAVRSDDAVIEDNRIIDNGSTFDVGVPAEHRASDCSAGKNASTRDNRTNSEARIASLVKGELRAWIGVTGSM